MTSHDQVALGIKFGNSQNLKNVSLDVTRQHHSYSSLKLLTANSHQKDGSVTQCDRSCSHYGMPERWVKWARVPVFLWSWITDLISCHGVRGVLQLLLWQKCSCEWQGISCRNVLRWTDWSPRTFTLESLESMIILFPCGKGELQLWMTLCLLINCP